MGYSESIGQGYLDRIRFAPKEARDIQLEVHARYDRGEPWMQEVIKEVDKIAGPLVLRPLDEIRTEVVSAKTAREWARLDRELRARPEAQAQEENESVKDLRSRIQEQVTPLVLQTFHRISEQKGEGALEQVEMETYARNGHPLKEADICDLFECSAFTTYVLEIEREEGERAQQAETELGRIYFSKLEGAVEFADLKKLHTEVTEDTRLSGSEKAKIIKAVNDKTVVSSIQVNHEQATRKETINTLHAVELVLHTNPDLLTPENLGDVIDETYRVIRLKEGFEGMKAKFPEISAHLVSVEADYKKKIKEMIEEEKAKDPKADIGDMESFGNLPKVGRGRGQPAGIAEIFQQVVQYHQNKALVAAFEKAKAEQEKLDAEARARGEEVATPIVSIGGGPRSVGQPLTPKVQPSKPKGPKI